MSSKNPNWASFQISPAPPGPLKITEDGKRRGELRRRLEDIEQARELGKLLDDELYWNTLEED
jgi:hypothetical protein